MHSHVTIMQHYDHFQPPLVKSHAEVGVAKVWPSTYIAQLVDSMQYVAGLSLT